MPVGRNVYCDIFGNSLIRSHRKGTIVVQKADGDLSFMLNGNGQFVSTGSCVLWPASDKRTWNEWRQALIRTGDFVALKKGSEIKGISEVLHLKSGDIIKVNEAVLQQLSAVERWATPVEIDKFKVAERTCKKTIDNKPDVGDLCICRNDGEPWVLQHFAREYWEKAEAQPFEGIGGARYKYCVPLQGNDEIIGTYNAPLVYYPW